MNLSHNGIAMYEALQHQPEIESNPLELTYS